MKINPFNKEEKNKTLAVRIKGDKQIQSFSIDNFIDKLKKEIENKE